jgi:hypothetical protein
MPNQEVDTSVQEIYNLQNEDPVNELQEIQEIDNIETNNNEIYEDSDEGLEYNKENRRSKKG